MQSKIIFDFRRFSRGCTKPISFWQPFKKLITQKTLFQGRIRQILIKLTKETFRRTSMELPQKHFPQDTGIRKKVSLINANFILTES